MTRIAIPSTGVEDWRRVLADPDRHWREGFSARSAAESWEAARGLPPEIAALFPTEPTLLLAIAEHKVALPGGSRPSQCDVFTLVEAEGKRVAMAVEAKVDEPFGPTVGEWNAEASPGRTERLSAICAWLGIPCAPPAAIRYQLLHRTAAAIAEAHRFRFDAAAMIVQSFSPTDRWREDFDAFVALIGARPDGDLWRITLPEGLALWLGWANGRKP